MPFIPHTEQDTTAMLSAIGADSINDLFDEIPAKLRDVDLSAIPAGLTEQEISRLMHERAAQDGQLQCFIGAGAYEHHIPAAVWEITTRGEFYSAYTPYQAEASQGTLQLLYEYQTMMASLNDMDVSNASLYDGATACAEAVLMAVRANRKSKSKKVLVAGTLNPHYRVVMDTITRHQGIELVDLQWDDASGITPVDALAEYAGADIAAVMIQNPNFFGRFEEIDAMTDWAHDNKALVIAVCNPTSLAIITPPGQWGSAGADIACGDGQPLGAPMSSGGPYFGFITCKQPIVRQMPGRIIGRTVDMDGKPGYALTLQAREQHIRRSKATSNICTNQGLLVTAATIHMSIIGPDGLAAVAEHSHANTQKLVALLTEIDGVKARFEGPTFHETVLELNQPVGAVLARLADAGIAGGFALARSPNAEQAKLDDCLLVCATETKTTADLEAYAAAMKSVLSQQQRAA